MAGAFLISKNVGVSISSLGFDSIAESTRKEIDDTDWHLVSDAYRAYDHEGMMFLDLMETTPQGFNIFCVATVAAMKAANPELSQGVWEELRQKLEEDPRYVA